MMQSFSESLNTTIDVSRIQWRDRYAEMRMLGDEITVRFQRMETYDRMLVSVDIVSKHSVFKPSGLATGGVALALYNTVITELLAYKADFPFDYLFFTAYGPLVPVYERIEKRMIARYKAVKADPAKDAFADIWLEVMGRRNAPRGTFLLDVRAI